VGAVTIVDVLPWLSRIPESLIVDPVVCEFNDETPELFPGPFAMATAQAVGKWRRKKNANGFQLSALPHPLQRKSLQQII
jgi:hypothetical protein